MSPVIHYPRQRADSSPLVPVPASSASPNHGLLFPQYLLVPLPFRRRRSSPKPLKAQLSDVRTSEYSASRPKGPSARTSETWASPSERDPSTEPYEKRRDSCLRGSTSTLKCMTCSADLCFKSQIISKGFNGRHGRAYLISPLIPSYLPHLHAEGSARLDRTSECQSSPVPLALSCLLGVENSALDNQPEDPVLLRQTGGITLPNTYLHKPAQRRLITGEHTVADLACKICGRTLGWKYVAASEEAQRYKVGKFIIEMGRVRTMPHWEGLGSEDEVQAVLNTAAPGSSVVDGDETQVESGDDEVEEEHWAVERARRPRMRGEDKRSGADSMVTDENVEFDSEDEDECEDLFAGVWSPTLARRWRRLRSLRTAIRKL